VATQSREEEIMKRLLPDKKVLCLLPAVELSARFRRYRVKSPLVLTGESRNPVRRFLLASRASRLHVVRAIFRQVHRRKGVPVAGARDLYSYYRSASIVGPITAGTGVKIKMLEALVATRVAAEGLPVSANPAWFTPNFIGETAAAVSHLLGNRDVRAELESRAFDYGRLYFRRRRRCGLCAPFSNPIGFDGVD
jgi:hypothetical protein